MQQTLQPGSPSIILTGRPQGKVGLVAYLAVRKVDHIQKLDFVGITKEG